MVAACAAGAVVALVFLALGWNLQITIRRRGLRSLLCSHFSHDNWDRKPFFPGDFRDDLWLLMAAGFTGSMLLPAAIGYVAKGSTVKAGIWLLPISAFLLFVVQSIFVRHEKSQQSLVGVPVDRRGYLGGYQAEARKYVYRGVRACVNLVDKISRWIKRMGEVAEVSLNF